jgi:hypothetical protein
MDVIERVKNLPEADGQKLLKALRFINRDSVDKELVSVFQKELVKIFVNPADTKRRKAAKKDKHVHGCLCDMLTDLFGKLGSFSGVVVFGIYVLASWRTVPPIGLLNNDNNNNNEEEKRTQLEGEEINKNT